MPKSAVLSPGFRDELAAVTAAGLYKNEEMFLNDAVRTFLAARPDLREVIACKLYEWGTFSLGRAAEWSGLSITEMKDALYRHGIARSADESPAEIVAIARKTSKVAGRAVP